MQSPNRRPDIIHDAWRTWLPSGRLTVAKTPCESRTGTVLSPTIPSTLLRGRSETRVPRLLVHTHTQYEYSADPHPGGRPAACLRGPAALLQPRSKRMSVLVAAADHIMQHDSHHASACGSDERGSELLGDRRTNDSAPSGTPATAAWERARDVRTAHDKGRRRACCVACVCRRVGSAQASGARTDTDVRRCLFTSREAPAPPSACLLCAQAQPSQLQCQRSPPLPHA